MSWSHILVRSRALVFQWASTERMLGEKSPLPKLERALAGQNDPSWRGIKAEIHSQDDAGWWNCRKCGQDCGCTNGPSKNSFSSQEPHIFSLYWYYADEAHCHHFWPLGQITGVFKAIGATYKRNGFVELYRGHMATLARVFPYAAINFMVYEQMKICFGIRNRQDAPAWKRILAGSVSGLEQFDLCHVTM